MQFYYTILGYFNNVDILYLIRAFLIGQKYNTYYIILSLSLQLNNITQLINIYLILGLQRKKTYED